MSCRQMYLIYVRLYICMYIDNSIREVFRMTRSKRCQTFSNLRSEKQTIFSLPLDALGSTLEFLQNFSYIFRQQI